MTRSIKVVKKKQGPSKNIVNTEIMNRWSESFKAWVHSFRERERTAVLPAFDSLFKEETPESDGSSHE